MATEDDQVIAVALALQIQLTLTADSHTSIQTISASDVAPLPGTTYDYRLRANNDAVEDDGGRGPWSTVRSRTTPVVVPVAPTLTAVPDEDRGSEAITIRWTALEGARETGGAPILYYEILVTLDTVMDITAHCECE